MKFNKRARLSTKFLRFFFFFSGTYNEGLKDSEERGKEKIFKLNSRNREKCIHHTSPSFLLSNFQLRIKDADYILYLIIANCHTSDYIDDSTKLKSKQQLKINS